MQSWIGWDMPTLNRMYKHIPAHAITCGCVFFLQAQLKSSAWKMGSYNLHDFLQIIHFQSDQISLHYLRQSPFITKVVKLWSALGCFTRNTVCKIKPGSCNQIHFETNCRTGPIECYVYPYFLMISNNHLEHCCNRYK